MDTPKNDNCNILYILALAGMVVLTTMATSFGKSQAVAEALIASYNLPPTISAAQAKSVIAGLEKALALCEDSYLAGRIEYRIGVLYFKAHMLEAADARFSHIADDTRRPEIIRACGLNMVAQISRMLGRGPAALDAFNQVTALVEKGFPPESRDAAGSALEQLVCAALIGRAEILEAAGDYEGAIAEYARLIKVLKRNKDRELPTSYGPMANDRASQLYLRRGNVDEYLKAVERLCEDYPQYYRTPVARFEAECVKFLKKVSADLHFVNGSIDAPALTIGYLKNSKTENQAQELISVLERLCQGHPGVYGEITLQYHHACLLDTLGRQDEALEIFTRMCAADVVNGDDKSPRNLVLQAIQEYARIQSAIMFGEKADYTEALRVLATLGKHSDESHISVLAGSVNEGLQVLRREVPGNEN